MALLVVHPWAQFFAGMLIGCWIGAAVACAGVLLLIGRKVRQLEGINLTLRMKLKARNALRRTGTGGPRPPLVMPIPGSLRKVEPPITRIRRVN
jgi:hypothetical protein